MMHADLAGSPHRLGRRAFVRFGAFVICAAAGFLAARAFTPTVTSSLRPSPASPAGQATPPAPARAPVSRGESPLLAEWEQLRKSHGADAAQFPALFAEIKEIKDAFRRRAFRAALLAEWAATDPMAGIAFLQQKDRGQVGQLFREWLRLDPNAAVTGLLANEKTRGELRGLLSEIARAIPSRLAEVVTKLSEISSLVGQTENMAAFRRDTAAESAFAVFAKNDLA